MYKIDEYIPDILYEQWDTIRETAVDWLVKLGIVSNKAKLKSSPDAPCQFPPLVADCKQNASMKADVHRRDCRSFKTFRCPVCFEKARE